MSETYLPENDRRSPTEIDRLCDRLAAQDEVLVIGAGRGVWLTVKYAPVDGRPDRYSVFEWGRGHIADLLASHVCASGWELRTLIDQIFRKAPHVWVLVP